VLFPSAMRLAPPAAGVLYDRMGSLQILLGLIGLSITLFVAVAIAATLGPYPPDGDTAEATTK